METGQWRSQLKIDPVEILLSSDDEGIVRITRRDVLGEDTGEESSLLELPDVRILLKKQQPDGSFPFSGTQKPVYPPHHYALAETFRRFRLLVKRYGLTIGSDPVHRAASYLLSCQEEEGDIRGFIGNQYATYYTGAIMALLIRAGLADDPRVEKGMQWLLSMRQDDGGWTIPILTRYVDGATQYQLTSSYAEPLEPDRSQPSSHNWTNMVLEAFAVHPRYRESEEIRQTGGLLKHRFFLPDVYTSYKERRYWVRFIHWWPNLLTALDSLALLGFTSDDPEIQRGLDWFIEHQREDGLWDLENDGKYRQIKEKDRKERLWLGVNICRMLKAYYGKVFSR